MSKSANSNSKARHIMQIMRLKRRVFERVGKIKLFRTGIGFPEELQMHFLALQHITSKGNDQSLKERSWCHLRLNGEE